MLSTIHSTRQGSGVRERSLTYLSGDPWSSPSETTRHCVSLPFAMTPPVSSDTYPHLVILQHAARRCHPAPVNPGKGSSHTWYSTSHQARELPD